MKIFISRTITIFSLAIVAFCTVSNCIASQSIQKLLVVGNFHQEEVTAKTSDDWSGLFVQKNGNCELKSTKVMISNVYDALVDDGKNGEKTGKGVSVVNGSPIFLIRNIPNLKLGPVQTAFLKEHYFTTFNPNRALIPGQTITLKLKNDLAQLHVLGSKIKESKNSAAFIHGFKIIFSAHGKSQIIFGSNQCNVYDSGPALIWAGDINGDNKIDLFMDITQNQNCSKLTLFLSVPSGKKELVKKAAEFSFCGC